MKNTLLIPNQIVARIISGEIISLESWSIGTVIEVIDSALNEGVGPLLYKALHENGSWIQLPPSEQWKLAKAAKREAIIESQMWAAIKGVLAGLDEEEIPFLLFKGTALSNSIYPCLGLRPRLDTDIFVREGDRTRLYNTLRRYNFRQHNTVSGELISHQDIFSCEDSLGLSHALDVHWKLSNPWIFSNLFTFEELMAHSKEVNPFVQGVRMPSLADSLIIACVHRVAHHYNDERLLWIFDIHLLAKSLSPEQWRILETLAIEKSLLAICQSGIALAKHYFQTPVPKGFLTLQNSRNSEIKMVEYLRTDRHWHNDRWQDLKNLPTLRHRLQYLAEHSFPSLKYMMKKYPKWPKSLIPLSYCHRILMGLIQKTGLGRL